MVVYGSLICIFLLIHLEIGLFFPRVAIALIFRQTTLAYGQSISRQYFE